MAPGRMTPLPPPMIAGIEAPWCGANERWPAHQCSLSREDAEHGLDRRDLQRLVVVELRQEAG